MSHFSKFQYNAVSQSKTCTTVSLPQEDMGYVIGKEKSGLRRIEHKLGNKVRIEARGCTFFITAVDVESVEKLEIAVELIAAIAWLKGKDATAWMKEMSQFYYTELHSKFSEMCGHFSDLDEHTHRMKAIHEIYAIEFEKATCKFLNDHNIRLNTFCYLVGLSYINSKEIDLYVNTAAHYELFCKMLNNLCRKPIERKITIDPNYLGRFIGKKGENIRNMERTFDVKIYVRGNITIQGKPEKVEVAIEYIKEKYPTQTPIIPQPHPERGHMYMDLQEKIMKTWRAKSFETIINNESHGKADSQFESLEHYGDSILKFMVVEILFDNNYPQGMMHDMEDRILSNRNLCKIFELLHMEALYTVQPSQFEIEVQKEKADVMEALIALLKKVNEVDILDSLISLITKIGSDHYIRSSTFNSAFSK